MAYSPYQAPFMAYNASPGINQMQSGYPMSNYQPPVYEAPKYQPAAQITQGNGIIWVQGEAGAKSYLVAPNATVLLMDSENSRFYLKSSDASGVPLPLRKFTYSEDTETLQNNAQAIQTDSGITQEAFNGMAEQLETLKSDYDNILRQYKELSERMDRLSVTEAKRKPVKAVEDNA